MSSFLGATGVPITCMQDNVEERSSILMLIPGIILERLALQYTTHAVGLQNPCHVHR